MSGSSTSLGGSGGRRCAGTPALIPRFLQVSRHGRTARIRDVVGKAAESFWEQLEEQDAERRLADRLASFREVNDGIGETAEQEAAVFVCECGSQECLATLELSVTEYKRIRTNRTWAVVTPGHESPGVERLVSERAGFFVVERLLTQPDETSERSSGERESE